MLRQLQDLKCGQTKVPESLKIILEHTQYTPSIYVKLLNTILPSTDITPLSVANQEEVDTATYIEVT